MTDWQPIETAPKDGTIILLYAVADPETGNWYMETGFWHEGKYWYWPVNRSTQPTYWQSLPAPPS